MSLVLDSTDVARWRFNAAVEKQREERQRLILQELANHQVTVAPDGAHDITNLQRQIGRPLTCEQLKAKLKKCNPNLIFERSFSDPKKIGVYIIPVGQPARRFICGMEAGISPEFTVIHTRTEKVANPALLGRAVGREVPWQEVKTYHDQTRGWWTVVGRLVHLGIVSMADVEKNFGFPSRDSRRWAEQFK